MNTWFEVWVLGLEEQAGFESPDGCGGWICAFRSTSRELAVNARNRFVEEFGEDAVSFEDDD